MGPVRVLLGLLSGLVPLILVPLGDVSKNACGRGLKRGRAVDVDAAWLLGDGPAMALDKGEKRPLGGEGWEIDPAWACDEELECSSDGDVL